MMHLYDRATMARALAKKIDPQLHALLSKRSAALVQADYDLTDWTEYLIVDLGDKEDDITKQIALSPLVDPVDGVRFGADGFHAFWDLLIDHGSWFEMVVSFGSTFAYVLFIRHDEAMSPDLMALCRQYATGAQS